MNKNKQNRGIGVSPTHNLGKIQSSRSPGPSVFKSMSSAKMMYFQVSDKVAGSASKRSSRVSACWPNPAEECPYAGRRLANTKVAADKSLHLKR